MKLIQNTGSRRAFDLMRPISSAATLPAMRLRARLMTDGNWHRTVSQGHALRRHRGIGSLEKIGRDEPIHLDQYGRRGGLAGQEIKVGVDGVFMCGSPAMSSLWRWIRGGLSGMATEFMPVKFASGSMFLDGVLPEAVWLPGYGPVARRKTVSVRRRRVRLRRGSPLFVPRVLWDRVRFERGSWGFFLGSYC